MLELAMAGAPAALLLRPVPSLEQHPSASAASVSSASLVSSSRSHGSFSLFLHHRRPQSFRPAISRIIQVQEYPKKLEKDSLASTKHPSPWQQKKTSNGTSNDKRFQNPPPWHKKSFDEASVDDSRAKDYSFRPAPWHQGSRKNASSPAHDTPWQQDVDTRGKVDRKSAKRNAAEADKSAMARIVEKLRNIQKTYDPVDSVRTGKRAMDNSEDGVRNGQGVTHDSREHASTRPSDSYNSGSRVGTGQRITHDRSDRARTGQTMANVQSDRVRIGQRITSAQSDRARTGQRMTNSQSGRSRIWRKETGRVATGTSPSKFNAVSEIESEEAKFPWERDEEVKQEEKLTQKKAKGPRIPSLAELTLSSEELKRLRILGLQMPERLKIGKLGVTRSIIISIQEQFTTCELVKVRCEGAAAASIKKTHLEIEVRVSKLAIDPTLFYFLVYTHGGCPAHTCACTLT